MLTIDALSNTEIVACGAYIIYGDHPFASPEEQNPKPHTNKHKHGNRLNRFALELLLVINPKDHSLNIGHAAAPATVPLVVSLRV